MKPERSPATDTAATARQIESESDSDPLSEAIDALEREEHLIDRRGPPSGFGIVPIG